MNPEHDDGQAGTAYPRTYRDSLGLRILWGGIGGLWGVPMLVGAGVMVSQGCREHELAGMALAAAVLVLLAIPGLKMLLGALKRKTVLFQDRIEVHEILSTRVLLRAEIAGHKLKTYRSRKGRTHRVTVLVPRQPDAPPLELSEDLTTDAFFDQWVRGLADLGS